MKAKGKRIKKWLIIFFVFAVITIIDIFVPDPVPLIDEIIFIVATVLSLTKLIGVSVN